MPSSGPIIATGEGRYQPGGGPFSAPTDVTATTLLPGPASIFTVSSPYKLAHVGWWALGIGIGGFYGATVDQIDDNTWSFIDFAQEDFHLPAGLYPDTLFWAVFQGNQVTFEVFW